MTKSTSDDSPTATPSPDDSRILREADASRHWKNEGEVGSLAGIAFIGRVANLLGRPVARFILLWVALYFLITQRGRVALCREFRIRAGAPTGNWHVYLHFLRFADCALDRLFFLSGKYASFDISQAGHDHIEELVVQKRGAILLGCHLGSFEALRAASRHHDVPLAIVADFESARRLNAILELFGDNKDTRFLDASGDRISLGLQVKEAIDRGELVAILGDRAGHGKSMEAQFLGARASFPVGPYLLAAVARCPIYFTTSLYSAPNRYELICEPFAERIILPRGNREAALSVYVQTYADRLAFYARKRPDNWFNFFPFWKEKA